MNARWPSRNVFPTDLNLDRGRVNLVVQCKRRINSKSRFSLANMSQHEMSRGSQYIECAINMQYVMHRYLNVQISFLLPTIYEHRHWELWYMSIYHQKAYNKPFQADPKLKMFVTKVENNFLYQYYGHSLLRCLNHSGKHKLRHRTTTQRKMPQCPHPRIDHWNNANGKTITQKFAAEKFGSQTKRF